MRRVPGQDRFEIIAGERRWRASQKAGLREVLVVVKDVSPKAAFELALINLLDNAVKFSGVGGDVVLSLAADGDLVRLE